MKPGRDGQEPRTEAAQVRAADRLLTVRRLASGGSDTESGRAR